MPDARDGPLILEYDTPLPPPDRPWQDVARRVVWRVTAVVSILWIVIAVAAVSFWLAEMFWRTLL